MSWNYFLQKKNKISRWHMELFLLGLILFPILIFTIWLPDSSSYFTDAVFTKKVLLGICFAIIGIAIWVLGSTVIIINQLREMLFSIKSINNKLEHHHHHENK